MSLRTTADAVCPAILRPHWERLQASPIASRLAIGVFWSLAGGFISRGLMLAATIVVARILGKTVYGELEMIRSTVGLFSVFAGLGLGLTATKHVAEFRHKAPARAGRILGLSAVVAFVSGGLMAGALAAFAPWIAENSINAPHLAGPLRIGAVILFLGAINGAQIGALSGFEAFRTIARINLLVGFLSFPMLIAGAYWGGLIGAIWALAASLGINWLSSHLALRKEAMRNGVPFGLRGCRREWPVLWRFSLPAVLGGALVGPVNWVCGALLVNEPDGYAAMGIYGAANQWFIVLLFLPSALGSVVLPVLSEQIGHNNEFQSRTILSLAIKINLLIVVPIAILASLASPFIMRLYGAEFGAGWPTLVVALATAVLVAGQVPVGQFIAASSRMWTGFIMNAGWALTFVGFTLLFLDSGSFGLASSRALAYMAHAFWTVGFAVWIIRRRAQR